MDYLEVCVVKCVTALPKGIFVHLDYPTPRCPSIYDTQKLHVFAWAICHQGEYLEDNAGGILGGQELKSNQTFNSCLLLNFKVDKGPVS